MRKRWQEKKEGEKKSGLAENEGKESEIYHTDLKERKKRILDI